MHNYWSVFIIIALIIKVYRAQRIKLFSESNPVIAFFRIERNSLYESMINMARIVLVCLFCLLVQAAKSQDINLITLDELERRINNNTDTTYIVNFWATWCGPCVKELPHFHKLKSSLKDQPVSILMVSVDFISKLDKQVKPFVKRHRIKNEVFLLNENNQQQYIDRVDKSWAGTIPATLFVYKGTRKFMEQTFSYAELLDAYNTFE
jgi:thiol-disulfide isomerase/thioredoxin